MPGPNGETHTILARATDMAGQANVEIKVGMTSMPGMGDVQQAKQAVTKAFRWAFKYEPDRVGAGVLPYVEELDGDEDEKVPA